MSLKLLGILLRYLYPKTKKKLIYLLMCGIIIVLIIKVFYYNKKSFYESLDKKYSNIIHLHDSLQKTGYLLNKDKLVTGTEQENTVKHIPSYPDFKLPGSIPIDNVIPPPTPAVLVLTDSEKSNLRTKLKFIFNSWKVNFDFLTWNHPYDNFLSFPRLQDDFGLARYQTLIFTSHHVYDNIDKWNLQLLKSHCKTFNIGILILMDVSYDQGLDIQKYKLQSFPVLVRKGQMNLKNFEISHSKMLKITKPGVKKKGAIRGVNHVLFYTENPNFEPVAFCQQSDGFDELLKKEEKQEISVLFDTGKEDGVKKVLFGSPVSTSFLHQLLFLDALHTLSSGYLGFNLERYIQIDVDDVFVGQTGKKLVPEDVKALIKAQEYFASVIPGFYFNLGFSSKFFMNSNNSLEREADHMLVKYSNHFRWFDHTYSHKKSHLITKQKVMLELEKNKYFAELHQISVDGTYSVSPHHSGIYPTHDALYDSWKEVWGVQVTSTEEYPHLYPAWNRKGFSYKDILVLPRQTCGLFTKTLHNANYSKGPNFLYKSSHGGELFWTIIFNPVSIFMTHSNNFGSEERLAIHLFKNVTKFIRKWTNINLISDTPVNIANKYFAMFPKQLEPVWEDPCFDGRHKEIWNGTTSYCTKVSNIPKVPKVNARLPDFLILGPQKTGTTALYSFLSMHPNLLKSRESKLAFEEIQFFNRNNYLKGLPWYMNFFPDTEKDPNVFYYDKSANYFDSVKTPLRVHSLLPSAKLVIITIDPRMRAYSWYQHMLTKPDNFASNHTFYEVVTGQNKTDDYRFVNLRKRCLLPGMYALALEKWLQYYKPSNIHLIDGYRLRYKPHTVMKELSAFLKLPEFPFHKRIRYNREKGFYCSTYSNFKYQCLGKGKGRKYPKMEDKAYRYLTEFYRIPNLRFSDLLNQNHMPVPGWLKKEIEYKEKNTK